MLMLYMSIAINPNHYSTHMHEDHGVICKFFLPEAELLLVELLQSAIEEEDKVRLDV